MRLMDRKIERFVLKSTSETKQRLAELEESIINDTKKMNNGEYVENFGLSEIDSMLCKAIKAEKEVTE